MSEIEQLRDDLMGMALMLVECEAERDHMKEMLDIAVAERERYRLQTIKLHTKLVLEGPQGIKI
jgi:hypothetical protein